MSLEQFSRQFALAGTFDFEKAKRHFGRLGQAIPWNALVQNEEWNPLVNLLSFLHGPDFGPEIGISHSEIKGVESLFDIELPQSLYQFYRLFGKSCYIETSCRIPFRKVIRQRAWEAEFRRSPSTPSNEQLRYYSDHIDWLCNDAVNQIANSMFFSPLELSSKFRDSRSKTSCIQSSELNRFRLTCRHTFDCHLEFSKLARESNEFHIASDFSYVITTDKKRLFVLQTGSESAEIYLSPELNKRSNQLLQSELSIKGKNHNEQDFEFLKSRLFSVVDPRIFDPRLWEIQFVNINQDHFNFTLNISGFQLLDSFCLANIRREYLEKSDRLLELTVTRN